MAALFACGGIVQKVCNAISNLAILFLINLAFPLFSGSLPAAAADAPDLVVKTSTGQVQGVTRAPAGAEFLGIPYAQAPVGDLRWREPREIKPWSDVRDARTFGAPCAQPILGDWNKHDAETSKEDCLFLNVITPVWPPKGKLPVMFWLHGGANAGGTASSPLYKDGTLAEHGVVLVTVNYRLGIFGFFAHPELTRESEHHASGNYGLMDQIAALKWVRQNIAAFGGDPEKITVFGQSAGAQDTSLLMTSPLSKTLFQGAIVESGSASMAPIPPLASAEKSGVALAARLDDSSGHESLGYLRSRSVADLLKAASVQDSQAPPLLGPILDGYVLRENPSDVFASGEEARIPLIIGSTSREFGFSGSPEALRDFIQRFAGDLAPRALELYGLANGGTGKTDPLYGTVGNQWLADQIFRCPVTTQAIFHHAAQHPTFEYQLEHAIPGQEADGAVHSADLPYVFGFYPKSGNISGNFGEVDFKISEQIERFWTNFAKTGDPNGTSSPLWPEFGSSQSYIEITQDGRLVTASGGLRHAQCELSRDILKAQRSSTKP
jgi:para-nitrobenzyl esterase